MCTLNQGRNEIRFNNSSSKCLIENWVEERAVGDLDTVDLNADKSSSAKQYKDGHSGLLTTNNEAKAETLTTIRDSYRPPQPANVRQKGKKQELLEKMLYEQVSKQVTDEFNAPPETGPMESIYQADYDIQGFVPSAIAPTASHDYVSEAPVTFWTEHRDKIHSVSQVKTLDTVFRKNTSFSKPIEEYCDQPKPYELEQIPKM